MKTRTPARKTPPAPSSTGDATRRRLIPAVGEAPCGPLQFPEPPRSNDTVPPRPTRGTCVLCPCAPGEGLSHRWKLLANTSMERSSLAEMATFMSRNLVLHLTVAPASRHSPQSAFWTNCTDPQSARTSADVFPTRPKGHHIRSGHLWRQEAT